MRKFGTLVAFGILGGGCAVTPYASITDIDEEDVKVLVQYDGMFATVTNEAVAAAAQTQADRGCERYGKKATYLSGNMIQRGNEYNGWNTKMEYIYTCN